MAEPRMRSKRRSSEAIVCGVVRVCGQLLLTWAVVLCVQPAYAQGRMSVPAGETRALVVADTLEPTAISVTPAGMGAAEAKKNGTDALKWDLFYSAPVDGAGKAATVQYTSKAGQAKTITVDIVAHQASAWGSSYGAAFKALFALFVVATLLEWALATLFNWRKFISYFDGNGAKTAFTFGAALSLVNAFDMDIMAHMVSLIWNQVQSDWMTKALSAMVLAGGSSGVNNLLVTLGFRSVRTAETIVPKPPATKAWISVHMTRDQSVGPVAVEIQSGGGGFVCLYLFHGMDHRPSFLAWLLRDPHRFPGWGGFAVDHSAAYTIRLSGKDRAGTAISSTSGPFTLGAGAIFDIEAKL